MKEKKKIKERLTSGSLAKKISNAISLLVIICMVFMVVISASLSGTFLTRSMMHFPKAAIPVKQSRVRCVL